MRARLTRHLVESSPQFQAAERALERKLALNPQLNSAVVDEWLARVWPERLSGIVDPISAQRMLEAFSDLGPRPRPAAALAQPALSGAQARLAAKDDGRSWTELIDKRTVPAELEAFLVDLDWLSRLDLSQKSDFQSF